MSYSQIAADADWDKAGWDNIAEGFDALVTPEDFRNEWRFHAKGFKTAALPSLVEYHAVALVMIEREVAKRFPELVGQ